MNPPIARIETFPLIYPVAGRFKFLEGPTGRKPGRPSVLVKITAADGTVGWGQSVPVPKWSYETLETVQSTIDRYLADSVLAQPFQVVHGELAVPPGVGLGVEVDESRLGPSSAS